MSVTINSVSAWLHRLSNGYTVVIAVALYGAFLGWVMVPESETVRVYAGDWGSPDGHWFYTPDELYGEISRWGDAGRAHYVEFRVGLDPVWALVYTAFLITITSVALRGAFPADDRRRGLNVFALLPMLADIAENVIGIVLIRAWPERLDGLAWFAATVSGFKWCTLAIAHVIMLYALAAALAARVGQRHSSTD